MDTRLGRKMIEDIINSVAFENSLPGLQPFLHQMFLRNHRSIASKNLLQAACQYEKDVAHQQAVGHDSIHRIDKFALQLIIGIRHDSAVSPHLLTVHQYHNIGNLPPFPEAQQASVLTMFSHHQLNELNITLDLKRKDLEIY